tara:strand:- start:324 stop:527 length:204 start_codon:yes stop_codon:yes gene_type:complete
MRSELLRALKAHATGHIAKHKANIEIYLKNPVGIGEHSDLIEAMEKELDEIARYHDQLEVIKNYLNE